MHGSTYVPGPARYGVKTSRTEVPVTMNDGIVLRVNVIEPTDPLTGAVAAGPFPVLLTQTPYGKASAPATSGQEDNLVKHGYIQVIADVRGTGDSEGDFGLVEPQEGVDGVTLAVWAARLPHSTGKVGLLGGSYLAIDQLLTAGAAPQGSPIKAIFPVAAANDVYRDTAFMGGVTDAEFDSVGFFDTAGLNVVNPVSTTDPELLALEQQHAKTAVAFNAAVYNNIISGGDKSFYGKFWRDRTPGDLMTKIVANRIPAYLVGGEYDLFQRGAPLNFAALQNAYAGRPTDQPMTPGQPLTGRYQLLDGPWTHNVAVSAQLDGTKLEWFDTWLKGVNTGMDRTRHRCTTTTWGQTGSRTPLLTRSPVSRPPGTTWEPARPAPCTPSTTDL